MVKKNAQKPSAEADDLVTQGEAFLAEHKLDAALSCFSNAATAAPTRQAALYGRGVAAAKLWEESGPAQSPTSPNEELLHVAMASFRKVLQLDTTGRSELRYLSALAAGRVLMKAADLLEQNDSDDDTAWVVAAAPLLAEACQGFKEAERVAEEWGHPDIGSGGWGDWGKAFSLEMRRQMAEADCEHAVVQWGLHLVTLSRLCEDASAKFDNAVSSRADGGVEWDDDDETDDLHWMTIHVEHLLSFVGYAAKHVDASISSLNEAERNEWIRRILAAWRSAMRLADAIVVLTGTSGGWKHLALRGDVLASGCELVCAGFAGVHHLHVPRLQDPEGSDTASMQVDEEEVANAERLAILAEAAFAQALAQAGEGCVSTVSMATGELLLGLARRRLQRPCESPMPEIQDLLQRAANAFQAATSCRESDAEDRATAWYNLACAAGLAGRPEPAAKALQMCFRLVQPPKRRLGWIAEAANDADFTSVRLDPQVQEVLSAAGGYKKA
eukprot:TRINITY_DN106448_c0_g1_i1.p1 TRINITY_DN106448_c0_g1~~TRINITY_DN106448_c0_g1_i1.p1  ORF type:complete len:513 (-),score=111.41 TRINITY_DN106448_c0_g1_i1:500-1999(-)